MNSPDTRAVVVGVDGTPGSAGALRYAVAEASRRVAPLHLVHVGPGLTPMGLPFGPSGGASVPVTMADLESVGAAILDEAATTARRLDAGIDVVTHLAHGSRAAALVEFSKMAQLVVIGRETRRGIERVVTGAVTAAVASRAQCDVVVVPSFWLPEHAKGRIVAGIKARAHTHELLSQAFAEASARSASLRLVTAWELADPYLDRIELRTHTSEWEADGQRLLEELASDWRTAYPAVQVETRVEHGHAATVLLGASNESDLLLVSRRHHALPPHGHLGGVAHALLRLSEVPVLVVPFVDDPDEPILDGLALEQAGHALK